ncbi:MAG: hypothetical protein MK008_01260 [Bdellovibrionales bacterium]|nr:hypothetical protein [Bdellovibrionales bacterium]
MRLYLYQQRHFLKYRVESDQNHVDGQILLPSMSLKKSLLELKKDHEIDKPEAIYLCTQFGQYIIEQNIGSKPVFITTQGFESSVEVHRPVSHDTFTLSPKRPPSVLNSDYIFGVDESVSSSGSIETAVDENQLEVITAKLKLSEKQNVAIGLLNSRYNNKNEILLKDYFQQQGYRCFSFEHSPEFENENSRWWHCILNAYMYPPFEDFLETLQQVFEVSDEEIFIMHTSSFKGLKQTNTYLDSSLSYLHLLKEQFEKEKHVLFLDNEDFFILRPQEQQMHWNTPVAKTYCTHPMIDKCNIQPTQYILQDAWGTLNYGYETLNYEPGPMLMGKGLKLSFVDLLFYNGLLEYSYLKQISQIGSLQKIDELLMAYAKKTGLSPKELADELLKLFVFQIKKQLLSYNLKQVTVSGDLAQDLIPLLQKSITEIDFKYVEHKPLSLMQQR